MAVYDDLADKQRARFRVFTSAVAGERAMAVAAGVKPGSPGTMSRSMGFVESLTADARDELFAYFEQFTQHGNAVFAVRAADMLARTSVKVRQIARHVATIANRGVDQGAPKLVDLMSGRGAGSVGYLAQQRLAREPSFKVKDSSGRKWDADKLIRVVVRDFAYQTYIDAQFANALTAGAKQVTVTHPDPTHELHGHVIDMTNDGWLEQRNEIFHVNSALTIQHAAV